MISLLCPTRKRPAQLKRMIESARAMATHPDMLDFRIYVDDDDPSVLTFPDGAGGVITRGPRIVMSDMWNVLAPKAEGDLLMLAADDIVFKTPGWDVIVEDAFAAVPDRIMYAFGDDGCPNGKVFGTHGIIHRRWFDTIGYFTAPGYSADYADAHPNDVAKMIGRLKYLPFETEHLHAVWGKAPYDDTYKETNARLHRDNTPKKYADELNLRERDADKLRAILGTPWKAA